MLSFLSYFLPDDRKDGSAYVAAAGRLKRINLVERVLISSLAPLKIGNIKLYYVCFAI